MKTKTSESENEIDNHSFSSSYATEYHAPVMARECINAMLDKKHNHPKNDPKNIDESQDKMLDPIILVDGTLGGGGHSKALLEFMRPGDILIGCDVDPDALAVASERLKEYMLPPTYSSTKPNHPVFIPLQSNFRHLHKVIPKLDHPYLPNTSLIQNNVTSNDNSSQIRTIDAILLDLGVSSFQINTPTRGFSIQNDGPLDMRMHSTGKGRENHRTTTTTTTLTAADICNEFDESNLTRILRQYGDEPRAKSIARSILQHRPLFTTSDLTHAVAQVTPEFARKGRRLGRMATLARVFQALRIVVNEEDVALKEALEIMASNLVNQPGGRLVVLSYHSMEDRMVKNVMRNGTVEKPRGGQSLEERDMYGNYIGKGKPWKMFGKGRKASEEEVQMNSRARSARLRVAERLQQSEE